MEWLNWLDRLLEWYGVFESRDAEIKRLKGACDSANAQKAHWYEEAKRATQDWARLSRQFDLINSAHPVCLKCGGGWKKSDGAVKIKVIEHEQCPTQESMAQALIAEDNQGSTEASHVEQENDRRADI